MENIEKSQQSKKIIEQNIFLEFNNLYNQLLDCIEEKNNDVSTDDFAKQVDDLMKKLDTTMNELYPDNMKLYKEGHVSVTKFEKAQSILQYAIDYITNKERLNLKPESTMQHVSKMFEENFK